jgi:type IV secretory pathway VirB10-like protein
MLDGPCRLGDDVVMGEMRPRWAKLPPAERERRMAQSAADRERATSGEAPVTPAERQRRAAQGQAARQRAASDPAERQRRAEQSRADREQAAIDDAVHRTVYGGDINFMSKDDW